MAVDADGHILGAYIDNLEDCGAFPVGSTGGVGPFVGMLFPGPYRVPLLRWNATAVWTNTCLRGAYRGPWMMETVAREQMMDVVARAVGLDPLELRRRNVIKAEELPYTTAMGMVYDVVTPHETLEQAAGLLDYDAFRAEQERAFREDGRLLGVGIGLYIEPSSMGSIDPLGTETATIRVQPTGKVVVSMGTGSHGQGLETTMPQVVAEELGVPLDDVVLVQGDTASTPFGRGTGGSGSAVIGGGACREAAQLVRTKVLEIAAHLMEAAPADLELVEGELSVRGTPTRTLPFAEVARVAHLETARLPEGLAPGLDATASYKAPPITWSNACHVCTVELDRHTGLVHIDRYIVSEDCGVMINPMVVEGQIAGGVVQGIGGVLYEHFVYDDDGNPLTTTFLDYLLPTAAEVPTIEYGHVETRSNTPGRPQGHGRRRRDRRAAGGLQRGGRRARARRRARDPPAPRAVGRARAHLTIRAFHCRITAISRSYPSNDGRAGSSAKREPSAGGRPTHRAASTRRRCACANTSASPGAARSRVMTRSARRPTAWASSPEGAPSDHSDQPGRSARTSAVVRPS